MTKRGKDLHFYYIGHTRLLPYWVYKLYSILGNSQIGDIVSIPNHVFHPERILSCTTGVTQDLIHSGEDGVLDFDRWPGGRFQPLVDLQLSRGSVVQRGGGRSSSSRRMTVVGVSRTLVFFGAGGGGISSSSLVESRRPSGLARRGYRQVVVYYRKSFKFLVAHHSVDINHSSHRST